jgi:hypothetical protein
VVSLLLWYSQPGFGLPLACQVNGPGLHAPRLLLDELEKYDYHKYGLITKYHLQQSLRRLWVPMMTREEVRPLVQQTNSWAV